MGEIVQLMTEVASRLQAQTTGRSSRKSSNTVKTAAADSSIDDSVQSELGKEAFLELLVTQLRYQDPLSPMENDEFIAQMAQFSSLEQMNNMNSNLESFLEMQSLSQGAALIGKEVEVFHPESGEKIEALVEKVEFNNGHILVHLENGLEVDIRNIIAVGG